VSISGLREGADSEHSDDVLESGPRLGEKAVNTATSFVNATNKTPILVTERIDSDVYERE
jgi:hypothetical protein